MTVPQVVMAPMVVCRQHSDLRRRKELELFTCLKYVIIFTERGVLGCGGVGATASRVRDD
jgi:hypothetical protein